MGEEGEIRNLDTRMLKHTGRGEEQHQPDNDIAFGRHRAHRHRLGHESREEREGRNRDRADNTEYRCPRHRLIEAAELARLGCSDPIKYRAHAHEKQALIDDVSKGVGGRAIQRQRCSDTDRADHETELIIERVGQDLAQVVLDDGKEDWEDGHHRTDPDQDFEAREHARKGIDCELRSERREHHSADHGGLRISILQPIVQEWEGRLDREGDENEFRTGLIKTRKRVERQAARRLVDISQAIQQQNARQDLDAEITHRRLIGRFRSGPQDQEY